ncbi:MAG: polyphosphate kinase 2 [Ardenticatenaceae bacterium]|nr:polyphosphate kinase 2 [Ardenticatenaceae bacterium]MCB9443428.1 polyphosphate kinase 2 [Ardenticatenaceae bacterium]
MGDDQENTIPNQIAEAKTESAGADGSSPAPGLTEAEKLASGNYFRSADGKLKKKYRKNGKLENEFYESEMLRLQEELVKLQYWVKEKGLRVVIVFEGRDAAGKGGVIKRITERTNPRVVRVVALGIPTEREKSQWYFQRWSAHLPAAGEIVLFDRSWYTRAITEYVMGFCTEEQYQEFMRSCPQYERMLVRSGIILLKYWFSVSDEEQEKRFQQRSQDPRRRWKLSPMDIKSRDKWEEYSKAKDRMFDYTDIKQAPWYVVNSDDKKRARLNCISHIVSMIPYEDILPDPFDLPPRKEESGYIRPPISEQTFVPEIY